MGIEARECTKEELLRIAKDNLVDLPVARALVRAQIDLSHYLEQPIKFIVIGQEAYRQASGRLVIVSGSADESVHMGWRSDIIPKSPQLGYHVPLTRSFSTLALYGANVRHLALVTIPGLEGNIPIFYAIGTDAKYTDGRRLTTLTLSMEGLSLTEEGFKLVDLVRSAMHEIPLRYRQAMHETKALVKI